VPRFARKCRSRQLATSEGSPPLVPTDFRDLILAYPQCSSSSVESIGDCVRLKVFRSENIVTFLCFLSAIIRSRSGRASRSASCWLDRQQLGIRITQRQNSLFSQSCLEIRNQMSSRVLFRLVERTEVCAHGRSPTTLMPFSVTLWHGVDLRRFRGGFAACGWERSSKKSSPVGS